MNCDIFGNSQLNNPTTGAFESVPGICSGIQSFFMGHSLAKSDQVLTWDPNPSRVNDRRDDACGSSYCTPLQNRLQNSIGDRNIKISCDEFPFAGTKEGGNYLGPQLTCVPAWQNTLQGNCNSKFGYWTPKAWHHWLIHICSGMLSQLQTNVAYFERQTRGDQAENFVT